MCGVVGIVHARGRSIDWPRLAAASERIRHRGPDDEGCLGFDASDGSVHTMGGASTDPTLGLPGWSSARPGDHVALAHRRLAIIDLTSAGHQPMRSADGRYWIAYNGEIYNFVELRAELERLGRRFRTGSDTEVLLEAFAEWGTAALPRLIGMFAFALLDTRERIVVLARDCFGIKPMYYHEDASGLRFASETKALLEFPGVPRRADPQQTYQFLRFGERTAGARTIFAEVRALPAAHYLVVSADDGRVRRLERYWTPRPRALAPVEFPAAVAEFGELLRDSVRLHMRSDVPVGACLSGGLDSTALVTLMRGQLAAGQALHTFSYVNEDARFSEERWIDLVEATQQHKVRPSAEEFRADVHDLVDAQDLPFISLSVYAQYRVFRLAHEAGIKVMIDGQGSDEILGGYSSLMGARLSSLLGQRRWSEALGLLRRLPDTTPRLRLRTAASAVGRLLPTAAQLRIIDRFDGGLYPPWLEREWFDRRAVRPAIRPHGRGPEAFSEELVLGATELTLPQLLRYEDRNSMHFSIESRVPFCVPALLEFALALDPEFLVDASGETKRVLRHAMRGLVPAPILDREKFGFPAPERLWLRTVPEFVADSLGNDAAARAPFLDLSEVRRMTTAALAGEGYWPPSVWAVLGLLAWARRFDVYWD
jgi:asparagine synthase (glutamine-hydrolysing)